MRQARHALLAVGRPNNHRLPQVDRAVAMLLAGDESAAPLGDDEDESIGAAAPLAMDDDAAPTPALPVRLPVKLPVRPS